MKLRAVVRRMLQMSDPAWYIFIRSMQLSCVMLFSSFLLLLPSAGLAQGFTLRMTALSLYETTQGILLLGLILSACLEDCYIRRS